MATLRLEIITVEQKVFDEQVDMVIAPGSQGLLGILPRHTPTLTALNYGELQIKRAGQEDEFFAIGGGFMEVQPDHVIVLADAAEHAAEIDIARAEEARRRAQERLATAEEEIDFSRAEAALRRSALRLKVARRRSRRRESVTISTGGDSS